MIVKVQLSEFPRNSTVLVYTEDQSVFVEMPAPKELLKKLEHQRKAYFRAELVGTLLHIKEQVPEQDW